MLLQCPFFCQWTRLVRIALEGSAWGASTNVWWNSSSPQFINPQLTIDLGSTYTVDNVVVSVDNNDSYQVEYSTNNSTWNTLFTILIGDGEVTWGMDTMNTFSGDPEYISGIDFASVSARLLRIHSLSGDAMYSVSELLVHGTSGNPTIPEPTSISLVCIGLASLMRTMRKKGWPTLFSVN